MKVGSLVVIIKGAHEDIHPFWLKRAKWLPVDDENTIYTIRSIINDGISISATLEEGIIGYDDCNHELSVFIEYLREVQPPMKISIKSLLEESILI